MNLSHVIEAARTASEKAYAPYSSFRVGAAVLTEGGVVHTGCNVENASYGLAVCAERNAVFSMVTDSVPENRKIRLAAVVSPDAAPCFPCGACRQFLHEFAPDLRVLLVAAGGERRELSLRTLLPHAFEATDLR